MNLIQMYRAWKVRKRINDTALVLAGLDNSFNRIGYPRQQRKEFWRKMAFLDRTGEDLQIQMFGSKKVNWLSPSSIQRWFISRRVNDAILMCRRLDAVLMANGYDRQRRRDFWRRVALRPAILVDTFRSIKTSKQES